MIILMLLPQPDLAVNYETKELIIMDGIMRCSCFEGDQKNKLRWKCDGSLEANNEEHRIHYNYNNSNINVNAENNNNTLCVPFHRIPYE